MSYGETIQTDKANHVHYHRPSHYSPTAKVTTDASCGEGLCGRDTPTDSLIIMGFHFANSSSLPSALCEVSVYSMRRNYSVKLLVMNFSTLGRFPKEPKTNVGQIAYCDL